MKKKIIVCLAALTCLAAGGGTALAYISDSAYVSNQLAFAGENGLNARRQSHPGIRGRDFLQCRER